METEGECEYSVIVDHAMNGCLRDAQQERDWFVDRCRSLNDAIENACESLFPRALDGNFGCDDLVMNSHQRRIGRVVLKEAASALMQLAPKIERSKNFEDLHECISVIEQIHGVGSLTTYDISERIGWCREIYPEQVYMHAGVIEGARAMRREIQNGKIAKACFPPSFQKLEAMEIETLMCCYKSHLADPKNFDPDKVRRSC
ncbi:hypothetical protein [Parasphingorhabdus sp.]|uniref:hypothetical protein n=1 Tax=Parasphingorhabdus sp. TaxID=2709688 RepID=UPI003A8E8A1B